jgi:hypothetical protein
MRFNDLTKSKAPVKLSYTESLQRKLNKCLDNFPSTKFTPLEIAIMEGGGSLTEFQLTKNQWELFISNADKEEAGSDLIGLVQNAYGGTSQGSFVNSMKDVIPSDWNVIDWDHDPDVDAAVFYRKNRAGESWSGHKIQGLGHDGTRTSKDKAIGKVQALLSKPGVWIESSDAMRSILKKYNVQAVTDVELLRSLFNDPNLEMVDADTYTRTIGSGQITETVFGNPHLTASLKETTINEFENGTDNSKQILQKLKAMGYTMLGSGVDATVWTKEEGHVIKILMPTAPNQGGRDRADLNFLTFYNFCQQNKGNPNLPIFTEINGAGHSTFEINGSPYRQIAMERLHPISSGFAEHMVWQLGELTKVAFIKWKDVVKQLLNPASWNALGMQATKEMPGHIKYEIDNDPAFTKQWSGLFATMQGLYAAGKKAGVEWDMHTDNVMERNNGTIVITDPFI